MPNITREAAEKISHALSDLLDALNEAQFMAVSDDTVRPDFRVNNVLALQRVKSRAYRFIGAVENDLDGMGQ